MNLIYTEEFKEDLKKVRDKKIQSVRIPPFRVLYEFKSDIIILHKFEHRKKVYR